MSASEGEASSQVISLSLSIADTPVRVFDHFPTLLVRACPDYGFPARCRLLLPATYRVTGKFLLFIKRPNTGTFSPLFAYRRQLHCGTLRVDVCKCVRVERNRLPARVYRTFQFI